MERREVLLTPELAKKYMKQNYCSNRNIRAAWVNELSRDILEGNWNPKLSEVQDPIIFSSDGKMINGQHRCLAVITANKPVKITVAKDVPEDLYPFLDRGSKRNLADAIGKGKNSTSIAAIAKVYYALVHGSTPLSGILNGKLANSVVISNGKKGDLFPTQSDLTKLINTENEYLQYVFSLSSRIGKAVSKRNAAFYAFILIVVYLNKADQLEAFVDDFASLASKSQPNILIKQYMCQQYLNKSKNTDLKWTLGALLFAYEHFVSDEPILSANKINLYFSRYDNLIKKERERRNSE